MPRKPRNPNRKPIRFRPTTIAPDQPIDCVSTLITAVGGRRVVSDTLGEKQTTVGLWGYRGMIPRSKWPGMIGLAHSRGRADVDEALLEVIHPPPRPKGRRRKNGVAQDGEHV
jgi:hypothetical protein